MNQLVIAFDVDDTLLAPPEATGFDRDVPNYPVIAVYKFFQQQGHRMIIWSGGGVDYARMWADKLGLDPDDVIEKTANPNVDICFDDCDVQLAKVNVKVKRMNNGVKRVIPKERDI